MSEEMIKILVPAAGTILTLLVSWGLAELSRYIRAKTKNENVNQAISELSLIVEDTVKNLNQTFTRSAADGKFTDAEKLEIKKQAMDMVKNQIPAITAQQIERAVSSLDVFINSRIEATVADVKAGKETA